MTPSLATFEDDELIKMALAGQTECFTVLMDRHFLAVKRTIRSMVWNVTDADDLILEVLLKVWRDLSTFRSEASFRSWMTRVAINEALQLFRRERYHSRCQTAYHLDAFASVWDTPHQHLDRTETTQTVRKAMARLPEKYRRVLVLREFEQLSLLDSGVPSSKRSGRKVTIIPCASIAESIT